MKGLLFIVFLLMQLNLLGQEVEEVLVYHPNSKRTKEKYWVLKSDKKVRHGEYAAYFSNNVLKEYGYYSYNQKDSIWTTYSSSGKLSQKGKYNKGDKVGIWQYYKENGDIIESFNHDTQQTLPAKANVFLRYPKNARINNIQGVVRVKVIYDDSCAIADVTVVEGIGYGCDEEAVNVFKRREEIRKKYGLKPDDCQEKEKIVPVSFKLE